MFLHIEQELNVMLRLFPAPALSRWPAAWMIDVLFAGGISCFQQKSQLARRELYPGSKRNLTLVSSIQN